MNSTDTILLKKILRSMERMEREIKILNEKADSITRSLAR